ncbi:hypothetical protein FDP41_003178 [Naegleria fowleri]|uniref:ELMO domain-containing protein n=1 Tax=Naegleria fowleri TaxID=5763 RepID=A0A6A5BRT0_NAEFO|nr:uncharacterized protein FDP41_003178 [Naegleria fowleri]KAF0977856.1 hypothetical protein FDP41_003178 [Naegleria fowleri]
MTVASSLIASNLTSSTKPTTTSRTYQATDEVNQLILQSIRNHQNFLNTKYDPDNSDHKNLLKSIFKIIFGKQLKDEELYDCQQWTMAGFQNRDPTTDLRSLGLLGLSTMEYLCKYHTNTVKNEYMNREYPFACCVFAIVNFMIKEMDMRNITTTPQDSHFVLLMKKELYFNRDKLKQMDLFERLFCIAFEYFDKLWVKYKAGYMDFSVMYDIFAHNIIQILKKEPASFSVFKFLLLEW